MFRPNLFNKKNLGTCLNSLKTKKEKPCLVDADAIEVFTPRVILVWAFTPVLYKKRGDIACFIILGNITAHIFSAISTCLVSCYIEDLTTRY